MSARWTPRTFWLARTVTRGDWENFWVREAAVEWWWTQAVRDVGDMMEGVGRRCSLVESRAEMAHRSLRR